VIAIAAAIVAFTVAGVWAERRHGEPARRASHGALDAIFYGLLPFVTFIALARLRITAGVGVGIALVYAELAIVSVLAWLLATRVLRLPRASTGALLCVVMLANTGFLGLGLSVALLGSASLPAAAAVDSLVSGPMFYLGAFAVGASFGDRPGSGSLLGRVTRNPPLVAAVAGLLAPAGAAPHALVESSHAVVWVMLAAGFFALGVNLGAEADEGALAFPPPLTRAVAAAVGLRLVLAPALLAGFAAVFVRVPHAYLLQAAMPSGINSLVIGHAFGLDLRLASSALAWTTAIVLAGGLVGSVVA
jgi:malate permease and related proteins